MWKVELCKDERELTVLIKIWRCEIREINLVGKVGKDERELTVL